VKPFLIERVLIAPYNISYHLEHHLYPAVPSTTCRRCITADGRSGFSEQAHMTRGYFYGLLKEL
jgi:fatty acid desaturase